MIKIYLSIFLLMLGLSISSNAQDPQFSQFYAAPLYLNPGFAGSAELARVGINYRNQWPSYPTQFVTYSAYFDYYFDEYNSGLGLLLLSDKEGLAGLNTNSVAVQYAYQLRLTDNLIFRPGLEGSYTMRNIDKGNLLFGDQIDFDGPFKDLTDDPIIGSDFRSNYFDFGAGGLLYTDRLWVGFAAHHLLMPINSFVDASSQLDIKYSVHAGYKILLPTATNLHFQGGYRDISITPTMLYKQQGQFSQMDAGMYFTYEPFVFGAWYRGLPFKPVEGIPNHESVIFLAGISTNGLHIGYSYDYTISKLSIATGGAHEISVRYEFFLGDPRKPPKNVRQLPCPKF
ncbi:MAG: type IX secretion system membrane protein PorP/SprF [Cyclobacteriaceae bacterium]|nr:type IX secretion system membrane protein PorP/SprF [Cyclobacteriaceae bacterium]